MAEVTVSLRVDKQVHQEMKMHDEINWSAVLRSSISQTLEQLDKIDKARAEAAARTIDKFRRAGTFAAGKKSVEGIREWRDKRR